jgi:hypothetical protein
MLIILQTYVQTLINFKRFWSLEDIKYLGQYGHHQVLKYI